MFAPVRAEGVGPEPSGTRKRHNSLDPAKCRMPGLPSGGMAADYEALEARVTELEHLVRNVLPPKVNAVACGLSLVHQDVRAVRDDVTAIRSVQGQHSAALADLGRAVAEILRRLPPAAE